MRQALDAKDGAGPWGAQQSLLPIHSSILWMLAVILAWSCGGHARLTRWNLSMDPASIMGTKKWYQCRQAK